MITDRNVLAANGERQLIFDRARVLWRHFRISNRILVVRPSRARAGGEATGEIEPGIDVESREYRTPLAFYRAVEQEITESQIEPGDTVIISGAIVLLLTPILRRRDFRVIVDWHADPNEWREHPPRPLGMPAVLGKLATPLVIGATNLALRAAHGVLVVSQHLERAVDRVSNALTFRVPCFTNEWVTFGERDRYRIEIRERLGFQDEHLVWAYSGGLSAWQMLDEVIDAFAIVSRHDPLARFLFLTPQPDVIAKRCLAAGIPASLVVSLSVDPSEVVPNLCAADIGMLLRQRELTNAAAFPNKFSEYVAAGLYVIVGEGAVDPAEYVSRLDLGQVVDPQAFLSDLESGLSTLSAQARDGRSTRIQRGEQLHDELAMESTLQEFAAFIRDEQ